MFVVSFAFSISNAVLPPKVHIPINQVSWPVADIFPTAFPSFLASVPPESATQNHCSDGSHLAVASRAEDLRRAGWQEGGREGREIRTTFHKPTVRHDWASPFYTILAL